MWPGSDADASHLGTTGELLQVARAREGEEGRYDAPLIFAPLPTWHGFSPYKS